MSYFLLPQSTRASISLEWCALEDLAQLDNAITCHQRNHFLSDIADRYPVNNSKSTNFSESFIFWISLRCIYLLCLNFDFDDYYNSYVQNYLLSSLVSKSEYFYYSGAESFVDPLEEQSIEEMPSRLQNIPLKDIHLTFSVFICDNTISTILNSKHASNIIALNFTGARSVSTESHLNVIRRCPQLEAITLSGKAVTNSVIQALSSTCLDLKSFNVPGVQRLNPEYLMELFRSHPQMECIDLSFCDQPNVELYECIATHCKQLKVFKIEQHGDSCTQVPDIDDFLLFFTNCYKLTHLNMRLIPTWDNSTQCMTMMAQRFKDLRVLNLDYFADALTSPLLTQIILNNTRLEIVSLCSCAHVDEDVTLALSKCVLLQELYLLHGRQAESTLVTLAEGCSNSLKVLSLHSVQCGDVTFQAVAQHCPNLTKINCLYTRITKIGLRALATQCKRLRELRVFKNNGSAALFRELREVYPKLDILHSDNNHDDSTGGDGEDREDENDEFGDEEDQPPVVHQTNTDLDLEMDNYWR